MTSSLKPILYTDFVKSACHICPRAWQYSLYRDMMINSRWTNHRDIRYIRPRSRNSRRDSVWFTCREAKRTESDRSILRPSPPTINWEREETWGRLVAAGHVIRVNVVILVVPESHLSLSSRCAHANHALSRRWSRRLCTPPPQPHPATPWCPVLLVSWRGLRGELFRGNIVMEHGRLSGFERKSVSV